MKERGNYLKPKLEFFYVWQQKREKDNYGTAGDFVECETVFASV
jgi:hypothetical protein